MADASHGRGSGVPDDCGAPTAFSLVTPTGQAAGERALLMAILEDAVRCVQMRTLAPLAKPVERRKRERLIAEALEWFGSADRASAYAFENVCEWLDYDAADIRRRVLEGRITMNVALGRAVRGPAPVPDTPGVDPEEAISA